MDLSKVSGEGDSMQRHLSFQLFQYYDSKCLHNLYILLTTHLSSLPTAAEGHLCCNVSAYGFACFLSG